ncbi:hypothetical protein PTHTG4_33000 [Parageobacillus thermoglucosidasius]|nr:hypothetical protein Geoth_3562 [Parageobacillus thermoglucosidasius C56-YS93]GCD84235.1 hypothetical protein PTHTG4_33000 [Parageobacillus thermoglucosidasius]
MPIKIKLKEILKERGISQRELARLTGCARTPSAIFVQTTWTEFISQH